MTNHLTLVLLSGLTVLGNAQVCERKYDVPNAFPEDVCNTYLGAAANEAVVRTIHFTGISIPDTVHGMIYTRNGNKIVITNHAAAACKNIDNYHEFDPRDHVYQLPGIVCSRTGIKFWYSYQPHRPDFLQSAIFTLSGTDLDDDVVFPVFLRDTPGQRLPTQGFGSGRCVHLNATTNCERYLGSTCSNFMICGYDDNHLDVPKCCVSGNPPTILPPPANARRSATPSWMKPVYSPLIPPETVCRISVGHTHYIQRTFYFKDFIPMPFYLQVFLHTDTVTSTLMGNSVDCAANGITDNSMRLFGGADHAQCYEDGLRIWYKVPGAWGGVGSTPGAKDWTSISVYGLRLNGEDTDIAPLDLDTSLYPNMRNLVLGECVTYANGDLGTSVCYRDEMRECSTLQECVSVNGPFSCRCIDGYKTQGTTCVDVDECVSSSTNDCDAATHVCQNTPGAYTCVPKPPPKPPKPCLVSGTVSVTADNSKCVVKDLYDPPQVGCNLGKRGRIRVLMYPTSLESQSLYIDYKYSRTKGQERETVSSYENCFNIATDYNLLSHDLLNTHQAFTIHRAVDVPDTMLHHYSQPQMADVSVYCYTNAIVFWMRSPVRLLSVEITGITNLDIEDIDNPNMNTSAEVVFGLKELIHDYYPVPATLIEPRLPATKKCAVTGASDHCFWAQMSSGDQCNYANSYCKRKPRNGKPSYGCDCLPGNTPTGGGCSINHVCEAGLTLKDDRCVDVNECKPDNPCVHSPQLACVNDYGTYHCVEPSTCPAGHAFDQPTGECKDVNECLDWVKHNVDCDGETTTCVNNNGGYSCKCKSSDQYLDISGKSCKPYSYEYRLMDPSRFRCCHATDRVSAMMVRCRLKRSFVPKPGDSSSAMYDKIEPFRCVHLFRGKYSGVSPTSPASPFIIVENGQAESLIQFTKYVQGAFNIARRNQGGDGEVMFNPNFLLQGGCEQMYSFQSNTSPTDVQQTVSFLYTNNIHEFSDPSHPFIASCKTTTMSTSFYLDRLLEPRQSQVPLHSCTKEQFDRNSMHRMFSSIIGIYIVLIAAMLLNLVRHPG